MELSAPGRNILEFLVSEIKRGRFRPYDEGTFCGYKEVHEKLRLTRRGFHWGASLSKQGLGDLAEWLRSERLPAITGLVVGEDEPRRPGLGYYSVFGVSDGDTNWWRSQVFAAIKQDWSKWVEDTGLIDLDELREDSLSYIEGAKKTINLDIRARCDAFRKRAKEVFRSPDGFLCCEICGWHKPPDGRISGDIVELHHINPIHEAPASGRKVTLEEAIKLLVPVCPNCHRMLHSKIGGGQFDAQILKQILKS
jgi:hypothetical protein